MGQRTFLLKGPVVGRALVGRLRVGAIVALLVTGLALLALGDGSVLAAPFNDVSAGHWTYGALEQLSALELIDGYPRGFFSGTRRLTRYEMALSLAGALERLVQGSGLGGESVDQLILDDLIAAYNGATARRPLTAADGELLRAVVVEFAPELEMLGQRVPVPRPPTRSRSTRWLLDASLDGVARALLQRGGLSADQWYFGPPGGDLRPRVRVEGDGLAASGSETRWAAVEGRIPIARLGGTVFYVDQTATSGMTGSLSSATVPGLDGTIHLSTLPPIAADGLQPDAGHWQVTETRAGMERLSLADNVSLSGERTQRYSAFEDVTATQVQAQVMLGDVSIDGRLRSVKPSAMFDPDLETAVAIREDLIGLGLTVRLGDVFLSTGQGMLQRTRQIDGAVLEPDVESASVRSLTLEYSFPDAATVTAGWQSVSDTRERTRVDVNVPVPSGALHFGLAYEGEREETNAISMTMLTMAGLDLKLWENAEARAAFAVREEGDVRGRMTSLGLRYSLNPEAAVLLGYKLIDFAEPEDRENVATAEFSIRF